MIVSDPNNIKIYNLSSGKSLPEWLSERKRRELVKKDVDIRKRIELIQDFSMPDLSNTVKVSKDGQYILATGIYKPRVRCFEVHNLSMKFERCMDSEIVTFEILSDDYSKLVFLQSDRFIEFHAAGGTYYRLRIPKFGRDMKYHYPSCDLYITAAGPDIYRLNLDRGQFLNSFITDASEVNRIVINPIHQLVTVGTKEGRIEAWDPRQRRRCGILDVALNCVTDNTQVEGFPSVTSLEYSGAMTLGVGTATGQILIFDIRSDKPLLVKDHMYGYAIRDLAFQENNVLSLDSAVLKIWDKNTGRIFTSIESGQDTMFNNLCHIPNSGLIFMANESSKIQSYYIPQLGPAPKWCSFLDNLTEELEESKVDTVYDDYKFVTKKDLEELQLSHLIGTQMLRAYMHGYFMNIRLYNKAKSLVQPFSYDEYKRKKIREKIEKDRGTRIQINNLPKVNRELALKLMDQKDRKKKETPNPMQDDRFKALFENPDFQIDTNTPEYRIIAPAISRLDSSKKKELLKQQFDPVDEEPEGKPSDAEDDIWSSDDEKEWVEEVKKQHREIAKERKQAEMQEEKQNERIGRENRNVKLYQLKDGSSYKANIKDIVPQTNRLSLGERLQEEKKGEVRSLSSGNREMTFSVEKKKGRMDPEAMKRHREDRKKTLRLAPNTNKGPFKKSFRKKRK